MEGPHTFTKILGRGIQNLRIKSTYPVKTQLDLIQALNNMWVEQAYKFNILK